MSRHGGDGTVQGARDGAGPDADGRALRKALPRSAHGDWEPAADRPDPLRLLERQEATRLAELVPLRRERMAASPFAFFRGAANVMAADLAATPVTGPRVQLCGDAHLANFGGFAAPDRTLVFDVNDFDETAPGPWEWDVKRLVASVAIAGRDRGFDDGQRERATTATARAYREALRRFSGMRLLDLWSVRVDLEGTVQRWRARASRDERDRYERNLAKAHGKTSLRAFEKLTETVDGSVRIVSDPPLLVPIEETAAGGAAPDVEAGMRGLLASYRDSVAGATANLLSRYRYVHAARKVVGVGSVGTRCWIVLLLGERDDDPLFLQAKEAGPSVLAPYAGAGRYRHGGRRVVEGQWLMQAASDVLLGWLTVTDPAGEKRDFYVRQLWDWKMSADLDEMAPTALAAYGQLCGATLARAHARSADTRRIAAYLGSGDVFDRALARFAEAYADQNERDHAALVESGAAVAR
ncbi:DUF2252 domain-containing protein [Conexibacter arvalis]|uniref:Uncharacterized protein (DUF2252 family) n=1 Tax=Conexibacter arvalis TaxID=912552 RepID=A0A840IFC2_9ACTN|nr:DUF2252 domain-containing protein [Conexibacter arvalis]MBB4662764.1 uncharacterized protein (DUF2252 family) [Conexibacter arvalis]